MSPSRLISRIQLSVLFANRLPGGRAMNRFLYRLALRLVCGYLVRSPGILSVYVRGSMAYGTFDPGLSDFDIDAITDRIDDEAVMAAFWRRFHRARLFLPLMKKVYIRTPQELALRVRDRTTYAWDLALVRGKEVRPPMPSTPFAVAMADFQLILRRHLKVAGYVFLAARRNGPRFPYRKLNEASLSSAARLARFLETGEVSDVKTPLDEAAANLKNEHLRFLVDRLADQRRRCYRVGRIEEPMEEECRWLLLLSSLAANIAAQWPARKEWAPMPALTRESIPPRTLDEVVRRIEPAARGLDEVAAGIPSALVLSPLPHRQFNYRLYLVVPDDQTVDGMTAACAMMKRFAGTKVDVPVDVFPSFPEPLLLTESLFRCIALSFPGALEPQSFARHGRTLWSRLPHALPLPESAFSASSYLRESDSFIGFMKLQHEVDGKRMSRFSRAYVDYVTGVLTARRLFYENGVATTTPGEAMAEYLRRYDDPFAQLAADVYARFAPNPDHPALSAMHYRTHRRTLEAQTQRLRELQEAATDGIR